MAPLETLADRLPRGLRPPRVAACDGSNAFHRRFVKVALFFVFPNRRRALFQPVAGGQIQHRRKRRLTDPRLAFQVRFQLARHTPTVDFGVHALHCSAWRPCMGCALPVLSPRFFGIPFGWQSAHFTKWILWPLAALRNVVSIFSTSRPQLDRRGWQVAQEARVCCPRFKWHARQLSPSCTPTGVRSSPEPTSALASGAWH